MRPPVPVPLLDRVTVWTCLAPSATPPAFLCTLSVASGCLCYNKAVRTELDILHRPALRVRGARSAWRATEPPPKPTAHPRNTAAAPGSRDNRTAPVHLPAARHVPETPQATSRQPEWQKCTWAARVVSALDRHKDAGIIQCTTTRLTPRVGRQATWRVTKPGALRQVPTKQVSEHY
jgi:hypothetical protein